MKTAQLMTLCLAVALGGCETAQVGLTPTLPEVSSIPAGVYTGTLNIAGTVFVGSNQSQDSTTVPFTVIIDANGRFLDGKGVPYMVGGNYQKQAGVFGFNDTCDSITVIGSQIVLRFSLKIHADLGGVTGEYNGQQTDTISYNSTTGELGFVRSQTYGGVNSDGVIVNYIYQADGTFKKG